MGALPQPKHLNVPVRKGPAPETRKLDRYGRDPESPLEQLRGAGFSPLYHAMLADLPRLVEGSAAGWALVMSILRLSLGRPHAIEKGRHEKTDPISTAELAVLCRVNVKTIQRQLDELSTRGVIGLKALKQAGGFVKYVLSLRLEKWQEIEDYAVWQRRQVVAIDQAASETETEAEDENRTPISKDAVSLFRKPTTVRPGRASRAANVNVGITKIVVENHSPSIDALFKAVVTSGCLVVSATFATGESEAKGETKANAERHACRAVPPNGGSQKRPPVGDKHPRAGEICKLFEPLLRKSGARLLSPDQAALNAACAELGDVPAEFLAQFILGPKGRGQRPIAYPRAVAAIIRECRENWQVHDQAYQDDQARVKQYDAGRRADEVSRARAVLADEESSQADVEWANEVLAGVE